jgi:transcriptional regulator of met regulon
VWLAGFRLRAAAFCASPLCSAFIEGMTHDPLAPTMVVRLARPDEILHIMRGDAA